MYKQSGFTLIELLVVIAIIAILTVIVVVAINPVATLNKSEDRASASNVRSTGTLISVCVAKRLTLGPTYEECADPMVLSNYGSVPANLEIAAGAGSGEDDVCAAQQGSDGLSGHYYVFRHSAGRVAEVSGQLPVDTDVWCPDAS